MMADPYAGFHDGPDDTRFVVFQINKDWYWQCMGYQSTLGPYPTAECAYNGALGNDDTS